MSCDEDRADGGSFDSLCLRWEAAMESPRSLFSDYVSRVVAMLRRQDAPRWGKRGISVAKGLGLGRAAVCQSRRTGPPERNLLGSAETLETVEPSSMPASVVSLRPPFRRRALPTVDFCISSLSPLAGRLQVDGDKTSAD